MSAAASQAPSRTGLLEVAVTQQRDVPGAVEGGADRLLLVGSGPGRAVWPETAAVSAIVRASDVAVRVALRTDAPQPEGGVSLERLVELAAECLAVGAEGVELGFLDDDLEVDLAACGTVLDALPGLRWSFGRAVDETLDPVRSWGRLVDLPGLDAVRSGGSPRGLEQGHDDLLALVGRSSDVARLLVLSGGVRAEQVPWFVRAGARQVHLGAQARPGATYRSYVDADFVRSWRRLLDDAVARAPAW